jgi:hypothetical protein
MIVFSMLCISALVSSSELPGITVELDPVVCTGSSVEEVSISPSTIPSALSPSLPVPAYEPPSEYQVVETLDCRFVIPEGEGIFPVMVDLFSEEMVLNPEIVLTSQAQQAVELSPDWLQEHLIWKFSLLSDDNQDRYGALLLAHQGQPYFDELAFTVAYISWNILSATSWNEEVLVENAQGIYTLDPLLSYVNVVDYPGSDYYSTTEYHTIQGGDTVWVEIPREIYYHFVVMPKVSDERPLNDATVYNEFWRQYLWDMDDPGYPVLGQVLNSNVQVFWDEQTKNYGWSTTPVFTDSLHAVDIVSKWTRATIPISAVGNRPIQPNVIAHEHDGNCGENQDLLCAAARVALIPCACVMDINEDHVWCSIWWDGEWRGWYVDTINNHNVAYDKDYGGSKDCSCIWAWRNDGYTWDVADYYSQYCTFTVTVTDSSQVPVDNATVQIASEGWQTSTLYRGTWGQTDRNGQITFILGDNQNYYMNIYCTLGTFGSGGYEEVITNSVPDQAYTFDWSPPEPMPTIPATVLPGGSWTKYLIQVDFDLPCDLMNGRDYYASPWSGYGEPLPDGTADFFIVDSDNYDLYMAGSPFQCYELLEGQNTGEVWFYAPHTDEWYIVFAGDRHQGVQTFAGAEITLWRHDGTGAETGEIPVNAVSLGPNPCGSMASVSFTTVSSGEVTVSIYDLQGRTVLTATEDDLEAGRHDLELDTSSLSSGLYFLRVNGGGVDASRSITVIR